MVKIAGCWVAGLAFAGAMAMAQTGGAKSTAGAKENVQSWRGMLMDAGCSGNAGVADSQTPKDQAGENKAVDSGRPEKHAKKSSGGESCSVSSSTTLFAIKTKDGQVMKFDEIGNARAAEELKKRASWSKDVSAGKPIHARVSGILNGDRITVTSI